MAGRKRQKDKQKESKKKGGKKKEIVEIDVKSEEIKKRKGSYRKKILEKARGFIVNR